MYWFIAVSSTAKSGFKTINQFFIAFDICPSLVLSELMNFEYIKLNPINLISVTKFYKRVT